MSRLTNKDDDNVYRISGFTTIDELIDKLAIYEYLEEQIGCPLEVVVKAIYSGVAYETKDGLMESEPYVKLYYDGMWFGLDIGNKTWTKVDKDHFKLSDYKKTWWLKEDKSE